VPASIGSVGHDGGPLAAAGHVRRRARSRDRSFPLALSDDDAGFIGVPQEDFLRGVG
jgi:hypothetical protein